MKNSDNNYTSPPRTHGTPSGYRNVRVLVPRDLHFRLSSYASQSHLSMPAFVVAWLNLATPLAPSPIPQDHPTPEGQSPGRRPGQDLPGGHSNPAGPAAAQQQGEPAFGHRIARGPQGVSCEAGGPCAISLPEAPARSSPDPTEDLAQSGSLPSVDPDSSPPGHRPD